MSSESRHLSVHIDRSVADVYDYAADPANLPAWAPGLGRSVTVVDGRLEVESPMGHVVVEFVPRNEFGVLDHDVTLPSGEVVHNPVRVIADGAGAEVVFTVRRRDGMTDAEFDTDAGAVQADLDLLRTVMEQ
jgi:uncharacterized protein YndB with AHSA1/START domain